MIPAISRRAMTDVVRRSRRPPARRHSAPSRLSLTLALTGQLVAGCPQSVAPSPRVRRGRTRADHAWSGSRAMRCAELPCAAGGGRNEWRGRGRQGREGVDARWMARGHSPVGREDETCHVEREPLGAERRHCETCGGITRGWGARMVLERGGRMRLGGAVDERGQHARVCEHVCHL